MRRYAQTHGPFPTAEPRARYGARLRRPRWRELERAGELVRGELRPGGSEREWCDADVLRRLRRASLAVLRKEIEPADQRAFAAFLPSWQGVDKHPAGGAGVDRLREQLVPLQGLALHARDVGARGAAAPRRRLLGDLDGRAVRERRAGVGRRRRARAQQRARRAVLPRGRAADRAAARQRRPAGRRPRTRRCASGSRAGSCFFTDLLIDVDLAPEELQEALWDLAWAGEVTNDAFAPLRAPRLTLARAQRSGAARAGAPAGASAPAAAARRRRCRAAGR